MNQSGAHDSGEFFRITRVSRFASIVPAVAVAAAHKAILLRYSNDNVGSERERAAKTQVPEEHRRRRMARAAAIGTRNRGL